jgi:hypothetical protein
MSRLTNTLKNLAGISCAHLVMLTGGVTVVAVGVVTIPVSLMQAVMTGLNEGELSIDEVIAFDVAKTLISRLDLD